MVVGPCVRPVIGTRSCLWCITWDSTQVSLEMKQDGALARLEVDSFPYPWIVYEWSGNEQPHPCEKPMAEDQRQNLPL